jgi:hypothetical protein
MFDLGRIGELVAGFLGRSGNEAAQDNGLLGLLAQAGIDPTNLSSLDANQLVELLQQHGVDASLIDARLTEGIDVTALTDAIQRGDGLSAIVDALSRNAQR